MIHLDRLVSSLHPSVSASYGSLDTTWTLPYSVPLDGSEGTLVAVISDPEGFPDGGYEYGDILTTVRNSADSITVVGENLLLAEVSFGVTYSFEYEFSRLYPRKDITNKAAVAETRGKLQLRNLDVVCAQADELEITVQGEERAAVTYMFSCDDDDSFRVPVMSNNEQVTITLTNDSPLGVQIARASWEGYYHIRNRAR